MISEQASLGEQASQRCELDLAPREVFTSRRHLEGQPPIGAMRANARMTLQKIPLALSLQYGAQPLLRIPSRMVMKMRTPEFREKGLEHSIQVRLKRIQIDSSSLRYRRGQSLQLSFPEFKLLDRSARAQECVALTQGAAIFPPRYKRVVFHVEHAPIQKPPPFFSSPCNKRMAAGFKADRRTMS